jgi:HlyD family secretion protein
MGRVLRIVLILAVVVVGSWFGYQKLAGPRAVAAPDYETTPVQRGKITSTVSATGAVQPERDAKLAFNSTGTIISVTVAVGDHVQAGQLLAQLDTADLELAVRQAEVSLLTAQAQLRQLQEGPNAADVAAAQASLASAQANYQQVLAGSDADQLASARAQVEQAKVTLDQAQQAYDKVKDAPNVGMLPQSLQLQQATINYETAQAQYRVTSRGSNQAQVAQAQAQIAQAQASLDKLQRGASATQIEISQTSVDQAQLSLEQARRRLDNMRLRAPWDGVITTLSLITGTLAQPATPAVELVDASRYHIDVQVDEIDIASLAAGQPVTVTVDALPTQQFAGHVAKIAPAASTGASGVVSYQVTIAIDQTKAPLLAGMSATTNITSNSRENVLLVPNRAVQVERETGKTFVERLKDGTPQRVEVRLGLRDDQRSEVRAGLTDGDQIVIRNVSSLQRLQQTLGN